MSTQTNSAEVASDKSVHQLNFYADMPIPPPRLNNPQPNKVCIKRITSSPTNTDASTATAIPKLKLTSFSTKGRKPVKLEELNTKQIADRMIETFLADIGDGKAEDAVDLLGQSPKVQAYRKFDALIWLYDLNPECPELSFDWVCDHAIVDGEILRRMVARYMQTDLRRMLRVLSHMLGYEFAKLCEEKISDYADVSGW